MNVFIEIMKPILPSSFDKNEIYTLSITLIVLFCLYIIHKRKNPLLKTEYIAFYLFNFLLSVAGDSLFAEPPFDFYDTVDKAHGELFDIILQAGVYPTTIIIGLQLYALLKPNSVVFIIAFASLLTTLEWVSVEWFNLFQYKEWKLFHSFIFYSCIMIFNTVYFHKVHHYLHCLRQTYRCE